MSSALLRPSRSVPFQQTSFLIVGEATWCEIRVANGRGEGKEYFACEVSRERTLSKATDIGNV